MKSTVTRTICRLLVALMIWTPFQVAQAGMIGTEQAVSAVSGGERAALLNLVARADVSRQLSALGVDAAQARDRIQGMTDSEVSTLAERIGSLPVAGDNVGGWAVIGVIVVIALIWWMVK